MSEFIGLKNLCTPAFFYLVISISALLVMYLQNIGNANIYCLGSYSCGVNNTALIFIIKIIYILFWTWLLNIICRSGYTTLSWILVLLPILLMFLLIAMMMMNTYDVISPSINVQPMHFLSFNMYG
jgi:hypothetical protein